MPSLPAAAAKPLNAVEVRLASWQTWIDGLACHERWLAVTGLLVVFAIGLLVRLADLGDWKFRPEMALYGGEALLATFDGY